jgi:probable HAF family extracellular repeat protein
MKSHSTCKIALIAVLGIATATCQTAAAATLYSVTYLDNGNSNQLFATGINNLGQVVGYSIPIDINPRTLVVDAFRTAPNSPINPATDYLGSSGSINSPSAINDLGQVVGSSIVNSEYQSFRTAPNSPINPATDYIGLGNFSFATDINNLGQIILRQDLLRRGTRSFRTAPNSPINLATDNIGTLGGIAGPFPFRSSNAYGINDLGQVVGDSLNINLEQHAFRTAPNSAINPATDDLGTLGGSTSRANAINNSGVVVGNSTTASGNSHAFRTTANSPINPATDDLGTLGGLTSTASAINNLGQVVGDSLTASGDRHAFLYDKGVMLDLNNLIPTIGFTLDYASGINDKGQIVAGTSFNQQVPRRAFAFLLTPIVPTSVPEPSSELGVLAFGALGAVLGLKRFCKHVS